jgi:microcystin-dependent protein
MADPYLGEIRTFGFNFPPKGWAMCNGQLLPINQNQALFSLLGTFYGGNGINNFALPNLQGRVALGGMSNPGVAAGGEVSVASTVATVAGLTINRGLSSQVTATAQVPGTSPTNRQPSLVVNCCIALTGIFPSRN